jgi:hypothetical protein
MDFFILEMKAAIATEVYMTRVPYSILVVICISYLGDLGFGCWGSYHMRRLFLVADVQYLSSQNLPA